MPLLLPATGPKCWVESKRSSFGERFSIDVLVEGSVGVAGSGCEDGTGEGTLSSGYPLHPLGLEDLAASGVLEFSEGSRAGVLGGKKVSVCRGLGAGASVCCGHYHRVDNVLLPSVGVLEVLAYAAPALDITERAGLVALSVRSGWRFTAGCLVSGTL